MEFRNEASIRGKGVMEAEADPSEFKLLVGIVANRG